MPGLESGCYTPDLVPYECKTQGSLCQNHQRFSLGSGETAVPVPLFPIAKKSSEILKEKEEKEKGEEGEKRGISFASFLFNSFGFTNSFLFSKHQFDGHGFFSSVRITEVSNQKPKMLQRPGLVSG